MGASVLLSLNFKDTDLNAENSRDYLLKILEICIKSMLVMRVILHENVSSKIVAVGV